MSRKRRRIRIDKMEVVLFGHPLAGMDGDFHPKEPLRIDYSGSPLKLHEVSLAAEPDVLREIAMHIIEAAHEMETNENFDHSHWRSRVGLPDIVVCRPR
jgi:hypothetical protein